MEGIMLAQALVIAFVLGFAAVTVYGHVLLVQAIVAPAR
jgi:hypothetical protein